VKLNTTVHTSGTETKAPERVSEMLGVIIIIIIIIIIISPFLCVHLYSTSSPLVTSLTLTANIYGI